MLGAGLPQFVNLFDESEFEPIHGQTHNLKPYRPYAEFEATEAVIISELTLSNFEAGRQLAQQLLATDTDLIIMTEDPKAFQDEPGFLADFDIDPNFAERVHPIEISHGSPWVRDFGGVFYFLNSRKLGHIRRFANFTYRHESYLEDTVPFQLALYLSTSVESVPFMFDGGNFMTDGSRCYVAAAVLLQDDNEDFEDVTAEQVAFIENFFQERIGCETLVIIDDYPHEHIDMWVKIMNKDHALVNTIPAEWRSSNEHTVIQQQLDAAAATLAKDFEVTRIPMLPPQGERFPTYTNASIVNQQVIVPRYRRAAIGDSSDSSVTWPEIEEIVALEAEIKQIYESFGLEVLWVLSDEFADNGGAIHCLSLQVPKDNGRRRPVSPTPPDED